VLFSEGKNMSSPVRSLLHGGRSPLPRFRASDRWTSKSFKGITNQVKEYIARYPSVLEDFLLHSNVSAEYLQDVLVKKTKAIKKNVSVYKQKRAASYIIKYSSEIGIEELCHRIITSSKDDELCVRIYEICQIIGHKVDSDVDRLYVTRPNGVDLALFEPEKKFKIVGPVGRQLTVSAHVAVDKKALNIMDLPQDSRFPKGKTFLFIFLKR
jgi:hypothetical protein